jgi:hypothetical protein
MIKLIFSAHEATFLSPTKNQVFSGDDVEFKCVSYNKQPIYECRYTVPDGRNNGNNITIRIDDGYHNHDYNGKTITGNSSFANGLCGIQIHSINPDHSGNITCSLRVGDKLTVEKAIHTMTVELRIDVSCKYFSKLGPNKYESADRVIFTIIVLRIGSCLIL